MATPNISVWIGRRIRLLRKGKHWTQTMLADHAQMSREHLSELENGKRDPSAKMVQRIARALGVSMEDFFRGQ